MAGKFKLPTCEDDIEEQIKKNAKSVWFASPESAAWHALKHCNCSLKNYRIQAQDTINAPDEVKCLPTQDKSDFKIEFLKTVNGDRRKAVVQFWGGWVWLLTFYTIEINI